MVESLSLSFRVFTAKLFGVRIFRYFKVFTVQSSNIAHLR